jgi:hypothetical protein
MGRRSIFGLGVAFAGACAVAGCSSAQSGTQTAVTVQVALAGARTPQSVDVHVFDPFGLVGSSHVQPAKMPGQLTISGLTGGGTERLRIVAVGDAPEGHLLGGVAIAVAPDRMSTASLTMTTMYADADQDDVPDGLDGCPTVPDPMQENALGGGPNDACRPDGGTLPGDDMATGGGGSGGGGSGGAGGTGGSAGSVDMATPPPPDMATPASNCANVSVRLCDGFESATLSNVWGTVLTKGTATVDTTRSYRGKSSLKLHNDQLSSADSDVEVYESTTFPSTHFYARAFVYVPSTFSLSTANVMFAEEGNSPYSGIVLDLLNGSFQTENTISNITKGSTTKMPTNSWVCLEWEVQTGSSGFTNLSVNGAAANGLTGTQNLAGGSGNPIAQFGLALIGTGTVPARDVWFDELIIDSAPIGCTK